MNELPLIMTPAECADYGRFSRPWIYKAIDLGLLRAIKIPTGEKNAVVRIRREDFLAFLERHLTPCTTVMQSNGKATPVVSLRKA